MSKLKKFTLLIIAAMSMALHSNKLYAQNIRFDNNMAKEIENEENKMMRDFDFLKRNISKIRDGNDIDDGKLNSEIRIILNELENLKSNEPQIIKMMYDAGYPEEIIKKKKEDIERKINLLKNIYKLFLDIHNFEINNKVIENRFSNGNIEEVNSYFNHISHILANLKDMKVDDKYLKEALDCIIEYLEDEIIDDILLAHSHAESLKKADEYSYYSWLNFFVEICNRMEIWKKDKIKKLYENARKELYSNGRKYGF